jgi:acyl carrier protein
MSPQSNTRTEAPTGGYHHGGLAACTRFAVPVTALDRRSGEGIIETVMQIEHEIERDIVDYLGVHYGIEPDEISDESTMEDLGVDSLGVLFIGETIEQKYKILLNDERIAGVRTLSDFKNLILLKIGGSA